MTRIQTGGHAFPSPDWNGNWIGPDANHGITMRDYFAAAALTGLIAQSDRPQSAIVFAREAYMTADAMLKAREDAQ